MKAISYFDNVRKSFIYNDTGDPFIETHKKCNQKHKETNFKVWSLFWVILAHHAMWCFIELFYTIIWSPQMYQ